MQSHLLLDRSIFLRKHFHRYEQVFAVPPMQRKPFVNADWKGLLFEGSFLSRADVYDALRAGSILVGDHDFVLTAMYGEKGFATSIEAQWPASLEEFLELRKAGQLDFTPASELFGLSSIEWGCCFFFDEYFHVSGVKPFIDCVAEKLGGYETLKNDFHKFAAHDWPMGAGDRNAILCIVGW